ncbi:MAG: DNA polymerase I [Dehalococcoidia bacterium]|nr:DNA polymerase I [Dehalococcoidia bacterium]
MGPMRSDQRRVLLLVDGNALVHRAFHALPPLTTSQTGEMVNAVYGFANTLFKVVNTLKASHWAIAFDYPAPTFRHAMFEQYKAQRPPTPEELKSQIRRVHQLADVLGMPSFELEGYEADDLLGTLAVQARAAGIDAAILTGDRDLLQVIRPGVTVLLPGRNFSDAVAYDASAVAARFGVRPDQFTAYKALVGDASDNIPGVPGIGEKTAAKLLSQFDSIDSIYEHLSEVTPARVQASLSASREQARASEKLGTIVTDVPVSLSLEQCAIGNYESTRALKLLRELEFNSLVARLPQRPSADSTPPLSEEPASVREEAVEQVAEVYTPGAAAKLRQALSQSPEIVVCVLAGTSGSSAQKPTERSSLQSTRLKGLGVSPTPGYLVYLPVPPSDTSEAKDTSAENAVDVLAPSFGRNDCMKVSEDVKQVMHHLLLLGTPAGEPWFDIGVAAHLVGEKTVSLASLALNRLGTTPEDISSEMNAPSTPSHQRIAEALARRATLCRTLHAQLEHEMQQRDVLTLFRSVEMPLVPVLAEMENNGILVDTQKLWAMSRTLGEQLAALEIDIYNAVGHRFNINSPKQLGGVLFDELGLQAGRKTSSGHSTEASQLEFLRGAHPVIELVLQYRQLSKLKSTYVDTLPGLVNPGTGRIHTVFSQTTAATGRLSSSDPNLQNLPIRTELGRSIRAAVIAPRGWTLLSADYSQIDLRALAHLSGDKALTAAFLNDEDIHTTTASRVFGVSAQDVTPEMRRAAKVVNFGVIYGMSDYGLEQATEFNRAEAGLFIKSYFQQYPGVQRWLEETKAQARDKGYVSTLLGRRRYMPEIRSSNRQVREAAERMAINAPVQGTSADIIKVAMIRIHEEMQQKKFRSRMLLQIHDELLFESPDDELPALSKLVRRLMPGALKLSVPLKVDLKSGPNWAEMKAFTD